MSTQETASINITLTVSTRQGSLPTREKIEEALAELDFLAMKLGLSAYIEDTFDVDVLASHVGDWFVEE